MGMRRVITAIVVLAGLAAAAPADATYHLMKVREVYPGSTVMAHNDAFIELQMYAGGQNFVGTHSVLTYNVLGAQVGTFTFAGNVANGESQRTILIGGTASAVTPDLTDGTLPAKLDPAGGAACWDTTMLDCVSWGGFNNALSLPTGTPAPSIGDAQSITRSIAASCPTLLESSDDTGNSAADFALTAPTPRNNSSAPTEVACGGPPGGGGDTNPPDTTITKAPKAKITKGRVKIGFDSNEAGSEFRCKLDKGAFASCTSPFKAKVKLGKHRFQVVATDQAGNSDASPAKLKFKRVAKH